MDNGKDPKNGQFLKGHAGKGGRPKGSRSKLSTEFVDTLAADFAIHGEAAIKKMREQDNSGYVKVISNLLPRQSLIEAFGLNVNVDAEIFGDTTSTEGILAIVAQEAGYDAAEMMAKMFGLEMPASIPMLELTAEADVAFRLEDEWKPPKRTKPDRTPPRSSGDGITPKPRPD